MRFGLRSLILIFICIFCIFSAKAVENVPAAGKRILWINTYSADDPWCRSLMSGFQEVMKQASITGKYEVFDLGIRYQLEGATAAADLVALKEMLETNPYDLVVTTDNSAGELFLDGKLRRSGKTPVLVIAYSGATSLMRRIPADSGITGIQIKKNLEDVVSLALLLRPDIKEVALITETVNGEKSAPKIDQRIQDKLGVKIQVISGTEYSTADMHEKVASLPKDSLLLFNSWMSSQETLAAHSYTVLPQIREDFGGLILGKYDTYMNYGSMGGVVQRSQDIGRQAGSMALRLLAGETVRVEESKPVICLDQTALVGLKIPISRAPKETVWVNIPPSFFQKYTVPLAALGVIVIVLLGAYSVILRFRRQEQLKNEVLFQHLPSRLFVFNRQGRVVYSHLPEHESEAIWSVNDLPDEISKLFEGTIYRVFHGGKSETLLYLLNGEHRRTQFLRLPANNPFRQDAVMVISSDVTELHNANLAAERLSTRLRLTLDSIGDGVITTDPEGRITSLNPIAEKLTGFTQEEAVGRKHEEVFRIIHALEGTSVISPVAQAISSGKIIHLANHTVLIAKDGTRYHINDSAAPILEDGNVAGGVLVFRDVSEDYNQRSQLRVQASALYTAMKIAKFNYFRLSPQGNLIATSSNTFWPLDENGRPLPSKNWADPEFVESLEQQWQALLSGESDHLYQVYSSSFGKEKQYFEVRLEKSFNDITGETELCGVIQDITEARRNEMLYLDNLNLFQTVVEHLPGFLFVKDVDDEFRFLLCNSRFEELMGHTSAELIGHRDRDFFVDENGLCKIEEDDKKLVAEGKTIDVFEAFTNSVGRFFAMRTVKKLLYKSDGTRLLLGMGVDLTREYQLEQKQMETIKMLNEYIASERVLYQLLSRITLSESFDSAINEMLRLIGENFDADRCYVFRYLDEQCTISCNTHEWSRAKEYSLFDRMQNVDMTTYPEFSKLMLERQPLALDDTAQPPAVFGHEFEVLRSLNVKSILGSGIWIDNKLYGFIGMDFDRETKKFTECDTHTVAGIGSLFQLAYDRAKQRELLEDSLEEQKRQKHELEISMEKVLAADRAKSYFLATVSHELRTPLNAIIGFSELMLHDDLERGTQEEYLRSVSFAGSTLLNLVNDVLDLSKLEAEQMSLSPTETNVRMLVKEVANVFKLKALEKGLEFRVELTDLSCILLVDTLRLRQVLLNLLGNAFKFTSAGHVELYAGFVPAEGRKTGKLTLRVSDSGIGISKETQANIFDPFVQDTVTRGKRVYEGSGLGLAITKRLLEKMGGKITLKSETGVGTSFIIEIDNVEYVPDSDTDSTVLKKIEAREIHESMRILIVDDVPVNLRVLGAMLKRMKVETVALGSAAAVLELLETDRNFSAILTDIWMPDTNGIELARIIRSNPDINDIPIVAVTADTQVTPKDAENFDGILAKPITIESLGRLFQDVIKCK